MSERVALITGGARGIGRSLALSLAADGWSVAICYRTSADDAATAVDEIEARGGRGVAFACDVSDAARAEGLVRAVEEKWGRIDALVNGAGPYHRRHLLTKETVEGWHEMFDNNLHPVFYLARAVAPGMRERGWGRIVSFAMANADQQVGQSHVTAHYIAKASLLILSRSLAKLLAPDGVTVNTVSPGFVDSGSAPPDELAKMTKRIPAGYIGTTDDVVGAVRYLLTDDARYVSGTNIHVSGAWGV